MKKVVFANRHKVGDRVSWKSSGLQKTGEVVAVVPAGKIPAEMGFDGLGMSAMPRKEESYVVKGSGTSPRGKRKGTYWPLTSLLRSSSRLTDDEINWCHDNAARVREMMRR